MAIDGKVFFNAAESICNLFYKTDHFKKNYSPVDPSIFLDAIEAGDADNIAEYTIAGFIDTGWPTIGVDVAFAQRNKRFAKSIHEIISAKTSFKPIFLFGASHLGGKDGIIQLLEKMGYKIVDIHK